MIFYFSATGNSRHVAEKIAESLGDRAIPIADCLKGERFNFISQPGEKIGFVCPVYNLGLPITVIDFIKNFNLNMNSGYIFTVVTFGGFSGGATKQIRELLQKKDIICNAHYSVRMPDTWTPIYDLSDKNKVSEIINNRYDAYYYRKEFYELKEKLLNAEHKTIGQEFDVTKLAGFE